MTSVNVRARVISVGNGTNRLICTAEKALSYGEVQVLATGENGKSLPIHISNLVKGTNKAEVKNGKIILHDVSPSEKVVVDFQVSGRQNYAMGVEVSGNQEQTFPYPVLCEDTDDYTEGEFVVDTEVVSQDINTLELRFRMNLDNPGLKGLISQGRAEYVIHIECSNTAFRTVIHTFSEEEVYRISNSRVNGEVALWE